MTGRGGERAAADLQARRREYVRGQLAATFLSLTCILP